MRCAHPVINKHKFTRVNMTGRQSRDLWANIVGCEKHDNRRDTT